MGHGLRAEDALDALRRLICTDCCCSQSLRSHSISVIATPGSMLIITIYKTIRKAYHSSKVSVTTQCLQCSPTPLNPYSLSTAPTNALRLGQATSRTRFASESLTLFLPHPAHACAGASVVGELCHTRRLPLVWPASASGIVRCVLKKMQRLVHS